MTLALYLSRQFGGRILAVGLVLLALGLGLDLLDNATDVIRDNGSGAVFEYAALRVPLITINLLPIAVLLGATLAFLALAARSELVAMRAVGVNTLRILALLAPLALALGGGYSLLIDRGAVLAEAGLIELFPEVAGQPEPGEAIWARTDTEVIRFHGDRDGGAVLSRVTIFALDAGGTITSRFDADEARWDGAVWQLVAGTTGAFGATPERALAEWRTRLTPEDIRRLATRPSLVTSGDARAVLAGVTVGSRSTFFYESRIQRSWAAWTIPFVMLLFAALAAFGLIRSGGGARFAAAGIGLGFTFVVADGFLGTLSEAGLLPPGLAAFAAPGLFAVIALWLIVLMEE